MHATDIIAYAWEADTWCPDCTTPKMRRQGSPFFCGSEVDGTIPTCGECREKIDGFSVLCANQYGTDPDTCECESCDTARRELGLKFRGRLNTRDAAHLAQALKIHAEDREPSPDESHLEPYLQTIEDGDTLTRLRLAWFAANP